MFGLKEDSKIYQLRSAEIRIGRHTNNNIVLKKSLKVSRFHAVIRFLDNKPFIKDVSSCEWGTYIGSHRILPDREIALKVGDILGIGSPASEDPSCGLELVFIESEPQKEPGGDVDNLATQVCDSTRDIETIDISADPEPEIIEIHDEEKPNEGATNIQNDRPSPALLQDNVTSNAVSSSNETKTKNKTVSFKTPTLKSSRKEVLEISDEETDEQPMNAIVNERNNATNVTPRTNEQISAVSGKPAINFKNLVNVTPTMNGLLRAKPELPSDPPNDAMDDADQLTALLGFDTPLSGSPIITRNDLTPKTNNLMDDTLNVKPEYVHTDTQNLLNYSMPDEIISLDSDEEDFPCSQLNTTAIADAADYSTAFNILYEIKAELQDYEEDVKINSYNDSWFEPLSQTLLAEDLMVESSKKYRRSEPAPLSPNDVLDSSQDEPLESDQKQPEVTESAPKELLSPKFPKTPISKLPKIPIIDAAPVRRHKRRSIELEPTSSKKIKTRDESESEKIYNRLKRKEKKSMKASNKHHSLTVEEKEKRKEKLKQIAKANSELEQQGPKTVNKETGVAKVKVTAQNRGAFLTELPADSSKPKIEKKSKSTSKQDKKDRESSSKKHKKESTERKDKEQPSVSKKVKDDNKSKETDHRNENSKSSLKQETSIPLEHLKHLAPKLPDSAIKIPDQKISTVGKSFIKSILKTNKFRYDNGDQRLKSKSIKFSDQNQEFLVEKWIRSSGGFLPPYKKYEVLIREGQKEFESALATVCSWNVKWLQEQQNQVEPPPLYQSTWSNGSVIEKYKSDLKFKMFYSLWKLIFNAWNVPESDDLPHTQFVSEDNYITIERVDTVKPNKSPPASKSLWTIYAKRELRLINAPIDITNGTLVILNFYVTKSGVDTRIKTMGFAYVASCNRIIEGDRACDKITFKIFGKPFKIEYGTAKMKILTYTKTQLRQFQALAMTESSPLISAICLADFHDSFENHDSNQSFKDKFLDIKQKKAVSTCLYGLTKESSVCLVDGASGTGKTQVIVSLLNELFSSSKRSAIPDGFKILIITYCDKDADDLLYRIEQMNRKENKIMKLLRFGNTTTVHQSINYCTIEKQLEELMTNHSNLIDLSEEISCLRAKINSAELVLQSPKTPDAKRVEVKMKIGMFQKELDDMVQENSKMIFQLKSNIAKENVIANADVIITTLNSCWSSNFENVFIPTWFNRGDVQTFTVCIFDDANLFNEAALLIPQVLHVPHLILVGDQKIRRYPITESPYHRLMHNFSVYNKNYLINLDIEHRMHPEVSEWVKNNYNLDIKPPTVVPRRKFTLKPFLVIDYKSSSSAGNFSNPHEYQVNLCEKIIRTIMQIQKENDEPRLGVIVASNDEKEAVKRAIPQNASRKTIVELLDGFSAREQDIVVLFLPNTVYQEWLYIGMTRPKFSLIVCGNFEEIQQSDLVKSLVEQSKQRNTFVSLQTNPAFQSQEEMRKILMT